MRAVSLAVTLILGLGLGMMIECCRSVEQRFEFGKSDVYVRLVRNKKLQYQIMKGSKTLHTLTFDNFETNNNFVATSNDGYQLSDGTTIIEFSLVQSSNGLTHVRVARSNIPPNAQPRDCFDLNSQETNWFGGPQIFNQYWPIQRHTFSNFSYLPKQERNVALAERYWLNSHGMFVYVENTVPLYIDQNTKQHPNQLCLSAHASAPYDPRVTNIDFAYHIGLAENAKAAHMYVVKKFFGLPKGYPDERMVQHPIWSTWALYKTEITDQIVRDFGDKVLQNGFENSQLEIDDDWEDCYGALTFRKNKFPNIRQLTDDLKKKGFRVTLWIHPFINKNCTAIYQDALKKGYLVLNHNGNPDTQWWNSIKNDAAYIDFTKPEVQNWFKQRVDRLRTEDGIDSFKFDAGESSWVPEDAVLQGDTKLAPIKVTTDYVNTVASFGSMVEVRTGQNSQDLPIFVRMLDKDSEWGWNNGLVTLITTLLQMNLNGYVFVLPDMIGGNGYNNKPPNKELFIRWLQANVFMPSLQFSYVPWNFDAETIAISQRYCKLHSDVTPYIMKRFKLAVETGEPVNAPLWWVDPTDVTAQGIYDQFLLGDDIIAAPVIIEGATKRDIYLPKGEWQDGNNNDNIYNGPIWLMEYPAPLDTLPYFVRTTISLQ